MRKHWRLYGEGGGAVCSLSSKHSEISLFPGKETVKLSSAFSCNLSFKNNRPCLLIFNFVVLDGADYFLLLNI